MRIEELYKKGISFQEFLKEGEREDERKTREYLKKIKEDLTKDIEKRIESIDKEIKILALGEIWCPDCNINIPALEVLSQINNKIEFKIIPREGHEEDFKEYEKEGKVKIPTFIIMDSKYKELGSIIERPKALQVIYDLNDQVEIIKASKNYRDGNMIVDLLLEVLDIIED